jgi:hypothetical protein
MKPPPLVVVQEKVLPVQTLPLLDSSNKTDCYSGRNGMGTYLNSPVNASMESPEATTSGGGSSLRLERNPCEGCGRDFKPKAPSTMGILSWRPVLLNLRKDGPTHLKRTLIKTVTSPDLAAPCLFSYYPALDVRFEHVKRNAAFFQQDTVEFPNVKPWTEFLLGERS